MKCFYHNDMDGKCAAAIVHHRRKRDGHDIGEYIEMNYDKDFPFDTIKENEEVFIVDFSLQKEGEFDRLLEITRNVIWIDHHKSAIEKHEAIRSRVMGIQDTSKAGCVLTWQFLFTDRMPYIVELLGDYDIWAFEHGDNTRDLQAGMKLEETQPTHQNWNQWLAPEQIDSEPERIIQQGKIIRKSQQMSSARKVEQISFYAELDGYRCICCNAAMTGSQLFDSIDPSTYDFMMPFYCSDRGWTISLYNTKGIDGTGIAKKYGGGGHPGACGFQCKQMFLKDGKVEVVVDKA